MIEPDYNLIENKVFKFEQPYQGIILKSGKTFIVKADTIKFTEENVRLYHKSSLDWHVVAEIDASDYAGWYYPGKI